MVLGKIPMMVLSLLWKFSLLSGVTLRRNPILTGGSKIPAEKILTTIDPNGNNLDTTDNLLSNYPAFDQFKFFFSRPGIIYPIFTTNIQWKFC